MHIRINYTKNEITAKYSCRLLRFHSEYICWTLWSSLFYYNFFRFFFIEKKNEKWKVYYVSLKINKNTPIVVWSDEVIYSQRSEFNVRMPERELNNNNPFESNEWNVWFFFLHISVQFSRVSLIFSSFFSTWMKNVRSISIDQWTRTSWIDYCILYFFNAEITTIHKITISILINTATKCYYSSHILYSFF